VQRAVDTRRAIKDPADILDSMSRSLRKRNAVDMVLCAAAVETSREIRARCMKEGFIHNDILVLILDIAIIRKCQKPVPDVNPSKGAD
jgi:hypothetical protein